MDLKEKLESLHLPDKYQDIIDIIEIEKANDFVKAMLNTIIRKYGVQKVTQEIDIDNPNSKISSHLTHIIEVGGLKIIADNKLNIENRNDFQNIILSVAILLNCSLAIELNKLNMYNGSTSNYYNNDAIVIIIQRLSGHAIDGMRYSNGFEYYANLMVSNNLLVQLTD